MLGEADTQERQGRRYASPLLMLLLLGFAAPLAAVTIFSVMPARTFSLLQPPTLENYVTIFSGTSYISLLWSLALATSHRRFARIHLLSRCLRPRARLRPLVDFDHAAVHDSPVRLREHPPLWLGAVLYQERRSARLAEVDVRHRDGQHPVHPRSNRARHDLCLPALHAFSDDARYRHGAERDPRGGAGSRGHALAGVPRG